MKRLACCRRDREMSIDLDEHERVMTYNGLERCIINSSYDDSERGSSEADGCPTDSQIHNDASSTSSSSKVPLGSFSSQQWLLNKAHAHHHGPTHFLEETIRNTLSQHLHKTANSAIQFSDVETMKERFAKLLLGEDISGGRNAHSTALALSNAITNLAASIFGELWKLEPVSEEKKKRWKTEMSWLLSPTNYMVELVPAKQNGINGRTLEIMTPKARSDIHMNLPALQKLDSMLVETLDSMGSVEFWYAEGGSRAEGRGRSGRQSMKWWLPSPRVPLTGLSTSQQNKLGSQAIFVQQVLKAAKSINLNVLLEMPVPAVIGDTIPKSARASLGDKLYRAITTESRADEEILQLLHLETEHDVLETANRLQAATFAWKQKMSNQSPGRNSWSFMREFEVEKVQMWCERAEGLVRLLEIRCPNFLQTFLDATKVQYNKDVGHSILEAYSRVLVSLACRILSRMEDVLEEDDMNKPDSPITPFKLHHFSSLYMPQKFDMQAKHTGQSLIDRMNKVDDQFCSSSVSKASDEFSDSEVRTSTATATPCRSSRSWCFGREVCHSVSPSDSP